MKKNSPTLVDDELHCACADVVHRLGGCHGGGAHRAAARVIEEGRRRFLQYFLVATLRRAFTLVQVNHVAVGITEHLEFDMARMLHIALEDHARIAECTGRFALRGRQRVGKLRLAAHDAHALATAAGGGLDHQRETGAACLLGERASRLVGTVVARNEWYLMLLHQRLGGRLGTHRINALRARADKGDARIGTRTCKRGVLGEKTITRVDRLRARLARNVQDHVAAQV